MMDGHPSVTGGGDHLLGHEEPAIAVADVLQDALLHVVDEQGDVAGSAGLIGSRRDVESS